jgi:hypothetical protein
MFSTAKLSNVSFEITRVRERIASRRRECVTAATIAARPIGVVDAALELGRRLRPLMGPPVLTAGLLSSRPLLRKVLRWLL